MSDENTDTKRIGQGMYYIFWLLVLAALSYLIGTWEKKQHNPNQGVTGSASGSTRIVELQRNAYGHYVTDGFVNGQKVVFMLDTGATAVAVPAALATKLGLHQGPAHNVHTANGTAQAFRTNISRLKVGNIELNDVRAAITPGMLGEEILLGMSALRQLDFSQSGNTLTLTQYAN